MRLDVNAPSLHEGYHARWDRGQRGRRGASLWRAEIPLTVRGQAVGRLEIVGSPDDEPVWVKIAALTERLAAAEDLASVGRPRLIAQHEAAKCAAWPAAVDAAAVRNACVSRGRREGEVSPETSRRTGEDAAATILERIHKEHDWGGTLDESGAGDRSRGGRASRNLPADLLAAQGLVLLGRSSGWSSGVPRLVAVTPIYQSDAQVLVVKKRAGALPIHGGDPRVTTWRTTSDHPHDRSSGAR